MFLNKLKIFLLLFLFLVDMNTRDHHNRFKFVVMGRNAAGRLCNGDKNGRSKPQQTPFTNISKMSAGSFHSLFQTSKEKYLHVGIMKKDNWVILMNLKSLQVSMHLQTCSISFVELGRNLFLDSEGNVFSVGIMRLAN